MVLRHPGVNVVAAVAEVGDLLGQQFYSLRRVAEDDALREESIKLSATEFLHRQMRVSDEPQVYRMHCSHIEGGPNFFLMGT